MTGLHREGPGDPQRLAGPECQQEAASLEIRARIGSLMERPATADQQTSIRDRSSAEIWLSSRVRKPRPRSPEQGPVPEERELGLCRRIGHAQAERAQQAFAKGPALRRHAR